MDTMPTPEVAVKFPHALTFGERSSACRLAIFGRESPDEAPPCLPFYVAGRRWAYDMSYGVGPGGLQLYSQDMNYQWSDVRVYASNPQVAAHLNALIHRVCCPDGVPLFGGRAEAMPYFEDGEVYISLRNPGSILGGEVGWRKSTGRNKSPCYPGLPRLPALLAAYQPGTDAYFWGRLRVMIIAALDEAGMFETSGG